MNMDRAFILDQLNAEYTVIQRTDPRVSRCSIRSKVNGELLHQGEGHNDEAAIEAAFQAAVAAGAQPGPKSKDQVLEERLAKAEAEIESLKKQLEEKNKEEDPEVLELRKLLDENNIKYHGKAGVKKLREIAQENGLLQTEQA